MSFPESLRGYEERRIDEPKVVAKELRALFPRLPRAEKPIAMGIYASCLRQLDKTEACLVALADALKLARKDGNVWAEANLLQRRSAVEAFAGDHEVAILTSRQALSLFFEVGDLDRVGTTLYDQGKGHFHLCRFRRSVGLFLMALQNIKVDNLQYHFACQNGLALSYAEISDSANCAERLAVARELASKLGAMVATRFRWTEATLLAKVGHVEAAEELLRTVAEEYISSGQGLEAALAIVELAQMAMIQGQPEKAANVSREARGCLLHLREGSRAAVIVESVWRKAEIAISEDFLTKVSIELRQVQNASRLAHA